MGKSDDESTREHYNPHPSGEIDTLGSEVLLRLVAREQREIKNDVRRMAKLQQAVTERMIEGSGRMQRIEDRVGRNEADMAETRRRCESRCPAPMSQPATGSEAEEAGKTINVKALVLTITAIGGFVVSVLTAVAVFFGHKGSP